MFLTSHNYCSSCYKLKSHFFFFNCAFSWRDLSRFLEKAMSVVALGNSLKSGEKASNKNYSRTSAAIKKNNSSLTTSTETQTSTGKYNALHQD